MGRRPRARRVGPAGLSVVRGPRADGRHYWRARVRGVVCWTGWATPTEAETATIQALADGNWKQESPGEVTVHTVEDMLDYWVGAQENRSDLAPRSLDAYRYHSKILREVLGDYPASRLGFQLGELLRDTELRRGISGRTVLLHLKILRMAARWATSMELGEIGAVPFIRVPVAPRLRYTPSDQDVRAVLDVLEGLDQVLIWLLWRTGCRPVALHRLKWGHVDTERGLISIHSTKTNPRRVPVVDQDLLEALDRLRKGPADPVCSVQSRGHFRRVLLRGTRAAGVEVFTPYALRRLAVDTLYRVTDPGTAAAIVGHSPEVALRHYRQASELEARAALARALSGAGETGQVHPFRKTAKD